MYFTFNNILSIFPQKSPAEDSQISSQENQFRSERKHKPQGKALESVKQAAQGQFELLNS